LAPKYFTGLEKDKLQKTGTEREKVEKTITTQVAS
jgi:hypothetical protein